MAAKDIYDLLWKHVIEHDRKEREHNKSFYRKIMEDKIVKDLLDDLHEKNEEKIVVNSRGGKQHKVEGRFDLIPARALTRVAIVLEQGAEKYGENNWQRIDSNDHINHAIAHLFKYLSDDRSEDHLTNAICRSLFASHMVNEIEDVRVPITGRLSSKESNLKYENIAKDESDPGLPALGHVEQNGTIIQVAKGSLGECVCGHHLGFHNKSAGFYTNCNMVCECKIFRDRINGKDTSQAGSEKRP